MSKHQVVAEYLAGRIDRREFIIKLTTAGVSMAAAVAYAETFSQSVAARGAGRDARGYVTAFQGTSDYPVLDTDEDGFTDDEEADCGSDPNDPNSTCDNVGGGGGLGTSEITIHVGDDLPFNFPEVVLRLGNGSTIVISSGTPGNGGINVTLTYNGTLNGSAASFKLNETITQGAAVNLSGLRAQTTPTTIAITIDSVDQWSVDGVSPIDTPQTLTLSGSGGIFTATLGDKTTTFASTRNADGSFTITPVNGLPNTGIGASDESNQEWLGPAALVAAGLALFSRRVRGGNHGSN